MGARTPPRPKGTTKSKPEYVGTVEVPLEKYAPLPPSYDDLIRVLLEVEKAGNTKRLQLSKEDLPVVDQLLDAGWIEMYNAGVGERSGYTIDLTSLGIRQVWRNRLP